MITIVEETRTTEHQTIAEALEYIRQQLLDDDPDDVRWLIYHDGNVYEVNIRCLQEEDAGDLGPNGRYEALGRKAGMGRPLTLDEALAPAG